MKLVPQILAKIEFEGDMIFRGHANSAWTLKPSIGRHYSGNWHEVAQREKRSLQEFKNRAVSFVRHRPSLDIEWLALMQHYGCATRLLDFTTNPLIALFFATDLSQEFDGQILWMSYKRPLDTFPDDQLFEQSQPFVYHPPHITERIIGQSGCFLYSPGPNHVFEGKKIKSYTVKQDDKEVIRRELAVLGVSNSTLFPGLDGICRDLNNALIFGLELDQELFEI